MEWSVPEVPPVPWWLIFMCIVAVVVTGLLAARFRRRIWNGRYDVKICKGCGANLPAHAAYCRQCGQRA